MLKQVIGLSLLVFSQVLSFDVNCNSNLVLYWGQNSYGVTHGNDLTTEKPLREYCDKEGVSIINLAFMHIFNGKDTPQLDFSKKCTDVFPGTTLMNCPSVGADIKYCQSKGVIVQLSLGGAVGLYGFANDAAGVNFSNQLWNLAFAGTSPTRPFGDAVLDGIDLDIEGGSSTGFIAMVNEFRRLAATDSKKKYYVTAAPQCPFPDGYMGAVLDGAWIDMVYIQFYNNYCGLNSQFNYADWDNWAKNTAKNKNVKLFVGLPGGTTAANNGYVDAGTISTKVGAVRNQYPNFGGLMFWDASQVFNNGAFGSSVVSFLKSGANCAPVKPTTSTTVITSTQSQTGTKTTSVTSTPTPTNPGNCPVNGVACTQEGSYACNGNDYAVCHQGKWLLRPCTSGTTCKVNGSSVICDWGNNPTCSAATRVLVVPYGPRIN